MDTPSSRLSQDPTLSFLTIRISNLITSDLFKTSPWQIQLAFHSLWMVTYFSAPGSKFTYEIFTCSALREDENLQTIYFFSSKDLTTVFPQAFWQYYPKYTRWLGASTVWRFLWKRATIRQKPDCQHSWMLYEILGGSIPPNPQTTKYQCTSKVQKISQGAGIQLYSVHLHLQAKSTKS